MGGIVSLVRSHSSQEEINKSIGEALDLVDFKRKDPVNRVDIKVNLCYYWPAATGCTTDPRVVAGVIDWVRQRYGPDIYIRVVEADGTAMRTKHAFTMLGYEKLAKETKVELFNLSTDSIEEKKVSVNGREITFQVPLSLLKSDLFINVPKLKILCDTKITCALKNIFGCIASPRKIVYHPILNEAIVGINKILHPNLTIVDGLIALGRVPVELGLIMASADPFSIDWVAAQIMGYAPSSVGYLRIAAKEKVGCTKGIILRGENIDMFKARFPKARFFFSKRWWNFQFRLVELYSKIVDDIIPPILERE
jgi:uncharacterized protein (DUF362 family)